MGYQLQKKNSLAHVFSFIGTSSSSSH